MSEADKIGESIEPPSAIDVIHALTAQINESTEATETLRAALEALQAENARLLMLLKPFADYADKVGQLPNRLPDTARIAYVPKRLDHLPTVRDCREARAALAEPGP